MKYYKKYIIPILTIVMIATALYSCKDDDQANGGQPIIKYIRVTDPTKSDSLLAGGLLSDLIAIVGENLGGAVQAQFNDQKVDLNPTYVTDKSILVKIPSDAPKEVTNKLTLIFENGRTLEHDFFVKISPPAVLAMENEWAKVGEVAVINGDYFFEPLTIKFADGSTVKAKSVVQKKIEFEVPASAPEGPITITTNFGESKSTFFFHDSRNIILNFDDKVANGWRTGLTESTDGPLDGNYLVIRGAIAANQRSEGEGASPLLMEYWGGKDAARSDNFFPSYPGSYKEYAVKFEAKVKKWKGGYLNLCLSSPEHTDNNQEIWSNDYNARAIWGPWAKNNAEFTTGDKWITVVIPMTEFQYYMTENDAKEVVYTPGKKFNEANVGTFSTWMLGSPENNGSVVEFYIDNIRFVKP